MHLLVLAVQMLADVLQFPNFTIIVHNFDHHLVITSRQDKWHPLDGIHPILQSIPVAKVTNSLENTIFQDRGNDVVVATTAAEEQDSTAKEICGVGSWWLEEGEEEVLGSAGGGGGEAASGGGAGGGGSRGTCGATKSGSLGGVGGLLEEPSRVLARTKALWKVLVVVVRLRRWEAGEGRLERRRCSSWLIRRLVDL
jgi:hypothetical protein